MRVIIGVGNRWRCDDGAGIAAAERLAERNVPAHPHTGDPASLMALWEGADEVILIDAVNSGESPGTVVVLDATDQELPVGMLRSTHGMGPADAVELARSLHSLPGRVVVYGIEGLEYGYGRTLSAPVQAAIDRVVEMINDA